jgi:hypothetical protein
MTFLNLFCFVVDLTKLRLSFFNYFIHLANLVYFNDYNASTYIVDTLEREAKQYGIGNLIAT